MAQKKTSGVGLGSLSRRTFLKVLGALGATAAATGLPTIFQRVKKAQAAPITFPGDPLDDDPLVRVMYTACQQCHSRCGLKVKVKDGVLLKVDGNPYNPTNLGYDDQLDSSVDPLGAFNGVKTKAYRGRVCAKAQAGIETVYNPSRLKGPLKRVGRRGEGKWESISWDQAVQEIVGGATLLGSDGQSYTFDGLKALRDVSTDLVADTSKGLKSGVNLGKVANQVVFSPGRFPHGNKELGDRIWKTGFGTKNYRLDHTSICETSHHVGFQMVTTEADAFSQKGTSGMQAHYAEARCVLLFGANPAAANFAHQAHARLLADALHGGLKAFVIDPRLSRSAELVRQNGGTWVPVKPGTDAALAFALIRYGFDGGGIQEDYLRNANKKAATDDSETTFSDATWLVREDTHVFLTSKDADLGSKTDAERVCLVAGTATAFAADDGTTAVDGDLYASTSGGTVTVNGIECKTALQLLKEEAEKHTVAGWAQIAGVSESMASAMGQAFFRADRRSVADHYRGPVQHTNGVYTAMSIVVLNLLVGSVDRVGGAIVGGGHYHETGGKTGNLYSPQSDLDTKGSTVSWESPSGPPINRAGADPSGYVDPAAYPAQRTWFPLALHGNYQEVLPSIADQYPYPIKAYFSLWNITPWSVPGGEHLESIAKDTDKLPLHVAIDVQLGGFSAMADYVLPDATYLEIFATPHSANSIASRFSAFRHPVVGSLWDQSNQMYVPVADFQEGGARSLAQAWEDAAKQGTGSSEAGAVWKATPYYLPAVPGARMCHDIFLHLMAGTNGLGDQGVTIPGIGTDAYSELFQGRTDLFTAWDFFGRAAANHAFEDDGDDPNNLSPPANDTAELDGIDALLKRGGRFVREKGYQVGATFVTHTFGKTPSPKVLHFYAQPIAEMTNSRTGKTDLTGLPHHEEPMTMDGQILETLDASWPFQVVTYKLSWHGQGRTVVNPSLMSLYPENFVWMNAQDGAARSLRTGDRIRITSPSHSTGVLGKVFLTEGIRPGVLGVSHHFGHKELFSKSHVIDGVVSFSDKRRGAGTMINPVLRLDPAFTTSTPMQDRVGGSVSFFDSRVDVKKA